MLLSARAVLTKHHRLNGFSNRHLFVVVLQDRKTKIEVPAYSVLCEGPFPDLQIATLLLCLHMVERGHKLSSVTSKRTLILSN